MDIRALTCFVAVAEHLNVARAAERLNTVKSADSQRIELLEREVGAQLLDRSRHHVRLTNAGRFFLVEVRRALPQAAGVPTIYGAMAPAVHHWGGRSPAVSDGRNFSGPSSVIVASLRSSRAANPFAYQQVSARRTRPADRPASAAILWRV